MVPPLIPFDAHHQSSSLFIRLSMSGYLRKISMKSGGSMSSYAPGSFGGVPRRRSLSLKEKESIRCSNEQRLKFLRMLDFGNEAGPITKPSLPPDACFRVPYGAVIEGAPLPRRRKPRKHP